MMLLVANILQKLTYVIKVARDNVVKLHKTVDLSGKDAKYYYSNYCCKYSHGKFSRLR